MQVMQEATLHCSQPTLGLGHRRPLHCSDTCWPSRRKSGPGRQRWQRRLGGPPWAGRGSSGARRPRWRLVWLARLVASHRGFRLLLLWQGWLEAVQGRLLRCAGQAWGIGRAERASCFAWHS
jgi:hypothetical protein